MTHSLILKSIDNSIGFITLNNPEKCNVITPDFIYLFQEHFHSLLEDENVHTIIIHGEGKHFCAGADLTHMAKMASASASENLRDAQWLTQLFELIYQAQKPTVCCVHGHVFGGGLGILAACDIVIADQEAKFCFPEVKLGLMPATIAPFVVQRIGYQHAKHHMLAATVFDTQTAMAMNLIDQISLEKHVLAVGLKVASELVKNDRTAIQKTKQWLNILRPLDKNQVHDAAQWLAEMRALETTQQKIASFLNKKST